MAKQPNNRQDVESTLATRHLGSGRACALGSVGSMPLPKNVAVRRIRRAYRKKHPEWRQEWDRLLREQYAVERRAAMKVVT